MKKALTIAVTLLFLTSISPALAANWAEVTTITGSSDQTTDYFTVPPGEWRITWTITQETPGSDYGSFYANVYPKGEQYGYVESIDGDATHTSGTTYIHDGGNRQYYFKIGAATLRQYSLRIEYDKPIETITPTPFPIHQSTTTPTQIKQNSNETSTAISSLQALAIGIVVLIIFTIGSLIYKNRKLSIKT